MKFDLPLDRMTVADKIAVMERLWDDLCRHPEAVASPDWHEEVLSGRAERVKEGRAEFIPLDAAKDRIRKSTK